SSPPQPFSLTFFFTDTATPEIYTLPLHDALPILDFPSPTGTPIHAAQSGRVTLAQELFFSGNTVVVDHGLGIYTFYGHLSEMDVKVGDQLQSGQVLGKVGATGRVTGPHLHWGLT